MKNIFRSSAAAIFPQFAAALFRVSCRFFNRRSVAHNLGEPYHQGVSSLILSTTGFNKKHNQKCDALHEESSFPLLFVLFPDPLRPGQYTFKVIAANSDGVWNNEGAQLLITALPAFYQTWWFRLMTLLAIAGSIGLIFKRRLDQAHRARRAQEAFSRQLIESQEAERKRIAAELHDSLGQNLLVIKNYALMALNTGNGENPMREHVAEISDAATLSIEEVRQIAHNLRPYQLERLGLTNTLQTMLRQIANASDIGFSVEMDPIDGLLSKEEEISLYRIVQEAINNILKHSGAKEASVRIKRSGDEIQMTIADDGHGFRLEPAGKAELQKRGFGLTGSAERVRMLGGTQTIQTAPGEGTTIHITIPTNKHASKQ